MNIERDLRRVLEEDLDFEGQFSVSRTYDAPNPYLTIDSLGLVGLPLGPAGAKAVIEHCAQAPFGKGERTIIDTEVRDTWEMEASKIQFRNPAWSAFVQGVVRDVCEGLGVNFDASRPHAELYKLLLYETGSHFLPHVDTEKADGMFASLIIILPSEFTGGDVHTSHGGVNTVFNSSQNSLTQTTALAWYTDVTHEVKPITSGYRFAISYNLLHTTASLRPALHCATDALNQLRHLFLSWNANESAPKCIYHLLGHQYSRANLSASALKGVDAHVIAVLDSLAREIGFGLGLANLELHMNGQASDTDPYPNKRRRKKKKWGYDTADDSDEEEDFNASKASKLQFGYLESTTVSVENFVDPDGNKMRGSLQMDKSLENQLETHGNVSSEYEGYMGNYGGTLDRYYRSSVLVIWPRWSSIGDDRRTVAVLERLQSISHPISPDHLIDFEYLCDSIKYMAKEKHQDAAFKLLLDIAVSQRDTVLWRKAVGGRYSGNNRLDVLQLDVLQGARAIFGFETLASLLRPIVRDSNSNTRLSFVENISDLAEDHSDAMEIDAFVLEMRKEILDNLRVFASSAELQMFTQAIQAEGGANMVRDRLVPQIRDQACPMNDAALEEYLDWVQSDWESGLNGPDDTLFRKDMVTTLLEIFIASTSRLFATKTVQVGSQMYITKPKTVIQGDAAPALSLVGKCLDMENPQLVVAIVRRMSAVAGKLFAAYKEEKDAAAIVPQVVFGFISGLRNVLRASGACVDADVGALAEAAVKIKLAVWRDCESVSRTEVAGLVDFVCGMENADALVELIPTGLQALKWNQMNWLGYMDEFKARSDVDEAIFPRHLPGMAKFYAQKAAIRRWAGDRDEDIDSATCNKIVDVADLRGGIDAVSAFVERLLGREQPSEVYINKALVALVPRLKQVALTHNVAVSVAPFADWMRRIVGLWIDNVLGRDKPKDLHRVQGYLQRVNQVRGCCDACARMIQFLLAPNEASVELRMIGAPRIACVRKNVQAPGRISQDELELETIRSTPQSLKATKSPELVRACRWEGLVKQGRGLLASVGDEETLQAIWGSGNAYRRALGVLVSAPSPPVAPVQPIPRAVPGIQNVPPTAARSDLIQTKPLHPQVIPATTATARTHSGVVLTASNHGHPLPPRSQPQFQPYNSQPVQLPSHTQRQQPATPQPQALYYHPARYQYMNQYPPPLTLPPPPQSAVPAKRKLDGEGHSKN
ncbi:hypothetical protein MKEN_00133800 [Mycena kentingensis (nom. inval.)]|nr:hypothetical protein MKEN_00133800 [Mycena kentingensis (nom. inval.)]